MKENLGVILFSASGLIIFAGLLINSFWAILFGCAVFVLGLRF